MRLAVFDREIAHSKDGDYQLRRSIIQLDAMLAESRHQLSMDIDPRSLEIWQTAAYQIRGYTSSTLNQLHWVIPKISTQWLTETVERTITAYNTWNIVPEAPLPSHHSTFRTPPNIPQRAHA